MLPNDPADDAYLARQINASIQHFDDVFDAIGDGRDIVDETGSSASCAPTPASPLPCSSMPQP